MSKRSEKTTINLNILKDSREKDGSWNFANNLPSNTKLDSLYVDCLDSGDYTLIGYEIPGYPLSVAIERKNDVIELCGNLGKNWERFRAELINLSKYDIKEIVVEDDLSNIYARYKATHGYNKYVNLPPEFILKRLAEIKIEFGISTVFMSNRPQAERYVANLFKNIILQDNLNDVETE